MLVLELAGSIKYGKEKVIVRNHQDLGKSMGRGEREKSKVTPSLLMSKMGNGVTLNEKGKSEGAGTEVFDFLLRPIMSYILMRNAKEDISWTCKSKAKVRSENSDAAGSRGTCGQQVPCLGQ